jgi:hypothetical protein
MYRFAGKQKFIELDPQIMVRLTKLIEQIDTKVMAAYKQTKEHNQADFEQWHERYKMWGETRL